MGGSLSAGDVEKPETKDEGQSSDMPLEAERAPAESSQADAKALQASDVAVSSESKAPPEPAAERPVAAEPEEEAAPDSQAGTLETGEQRDAQDDSPEHSQHEEAFGSGQPDQGKPGRSLEQMMSLKPNDDERTGISKKISWILRHGAKKVNVNIDEFGWVNVTDLLNSEILDGTTEDKLLAMITESNVQKTRYEMEDDPKGGKRIRAISKSRRNAFAREMREKERREREKKRDEDARERETKEREPRDRDRTDRDRDAVREPKEGRRREDGRWWEREDCQEGPTYEQQIREGFVPVWQGNKLVAMARENETVRPGRRAHAYGGKGERGDGKGLERHEKGEGREGKGEGKSHEKGERGERKGRGRDEKGKGKFSDDSKGFHSGKGDGYKGDGFKDGYRHQEAKEEEERAEVAMGDRYGRGSRQMRWRAVSDRDIIVRVGLGMETDIVGTLLAGSLVAQVGEDKMLKNGIARMFIQSIEPTPGIKGWVTRSAEAAGGPVFFKPDRAPVRERGNEGGKSTGKGQFRGEKGEKGEKGKHEAKGKGKRYGGDADAGRLNQPADQPAPVVSAAAAAASQ
ncbi:unnamed protein product [Effrenium voratum]|nr:unnamed protein product [Effrenium voratum]